LAISPIIGKVVFADVIAPCIIEPDNIRVPPTRLTSHELWQLKLRNAAIIIFDLLMNIIIVLAIDFFIIQYKNFVRLFIKVLRLEYGCKIITASILAAFLSNTIWGLIIFPILLR